VRRWDSCRSRFGTWAKEEERDELPTSTPVSQANNSRDLTVFDIGLSSSLITS